jgi:hypothetical protein
MVFDNGHTYHSVKIASGGNEKDLLDWNLGRQSIRKDHIRICIGSKDTKFVVMNQMVIIPTGMGYKHVVGCIEVPTNISPKAKEVKMVRQMDG